MYLMIKSCLVLILSIYGATPLKHLPRPMSPLDDLDRYDPVSYFPSERFSSSSSPSSTLSDLRKNGDRGEYEKPSRNPDPAPPPPSIVTYHGGRRNDHEKPSRHPDPAPPPPSIVTYHEERKVIGRSGSDILEQHNKDTVINKKFISEVPYESPSLNIISRMMVVGEVSGPLPVKPEDRSSTHASKQRSYSSPPQLRPLHHERDLHRGDRSPEIITAEDVYKRRGWGWSYGRDQSYGYSGCYPPTTPTTTTTRAPPPETHYHGWGWGDYHYKPPTTTTTTTTTEPPRRGWGQYETSSKRPREYYSSESGNSNRYTYRHYWSSNGRFHEYDRHPPPTTTTTPKPYSHGWGWYERQEGGYQNRGHERNNEYHSYNNRESLLEPLKNRDRSYSSWSESYYNGDRDSRSDNSSQKNGRYTIYDENRYNGTFSQGSSGNRALSPPSEGLYTVSFTVVPGKATWVDNNGIETKKVSRSVNATKINL